MTVATLESLVGQLADPNTRGEVARALAVRLGADDMLLFLRDQTAGLLLPAPGFRQTLRGGAMWSAFVSTVQADGSQHGLVPDPNGDGEVAALGLCVAHDAIVVLVGGDPEESAVMRALALFPLLVAVTRAEHAVRTQRAEAQIAARKASQAEVLARALEQSRDLLRAALVEAHEAREVMEQQAMELGAQAEELEQASEELAVTNEELVRTNEQLHQTTADAERARIAAEEANKTKAGFLAMMSHELRTPLNAIGGYAGLLEEEVMGPLTKGQLEYVGRIKRSQGHLLSLINDVLNFAKVEAGRISYHMERMDIARVVLSVSPLVEPMALARGVHFDVDVPDEALWVCADRDKVVQVVLNILGNAMKFTQPGGHVRLDVIDAGDDVHIAVSDSGPGIEPSKLASIFEPFVQLERTLTQDQEGVGLGLAISRELATGMKGELRVSSILGEGSTFTLALPRETTLVARS